jgi:hypothetical protein
MNMSADRKFKATSKSNPCPICGNVTGHCKSRDGDRGDLLFYCHNHESKPSGPINGFHWTSASDKTGWTGGIFSAEKPQYQGTRTKAKTAAGSSKSIPIVTPTERHVAFRAYMSKLTLHPDDRSDLHNRGLTDEQIEEWGVVSIEGKEPGYICPCYSPEGLIVGAQWRLRGGGGPRYKWVSWIGGGTNNSDELPLAVQHPIDGKPKGIVVCEGIGAKSFILAQKTGMVAIGAGSDSQFVSSPNHWQSYLATLSTELNNKTLTFFPDAGSVKNESVMGKYKQWFELVEDWGYTVQVAWWGQFTKGESPDPDELTADVVVDLISVDEFCSHASPSPADSEIPWKCLSSHLDQLGSWKTQDLGKNSYEMAKVDALLEEVKVNPNLEYRGSRMAQANGSQDAHPLHTFAEFQPAMNLDFTVTKMIESPDGGMLELKTVQRQGNRKVRQIALIKSTDTTKVDGFVNALKKALGRNIVCNLKPQHLQALLQNRTAQYQIAGGRTFRLAPRTGRQDDKYWVFEHVQFNPDGKICTEEESRWLFNRSLGIDEQVVSPKIGPQNLTAIGELIAAASEYYDSASFPRALMVLGYGAATAHRQEIMDAYGSFPQINTFGDAGGGKTLAATMACSLFGTHIAPIAAFSESVIYETVKSIGSMPLLIDDPLKRERKNGNLGAQVDSFLWNLYGSAPRKVRGNEQRPQTNVIVTSNKALGEGTQAIESRLIKISFPVKKFNEMNRERLADAIRGASSGLGQIIGMKFDRMAIREIARKLTPYLTGSHARMVDNYAILVHYTQQLCDVAGYAFDALKFCIEQMCPAANAFDSDKDSLTDFLEKLSTMKSEGVIGEWNMSQVTKGFKPFLAIQMQSIWPLFEQRYQVNYSRQSIEALIIERDGMTGGTQRFVASKTEWQDYQRALNQFEMGTGATTAPTKPRKKAQAKCVLIPVASVDAAIGGTDATDTNYSDNPTPAWEPPVVTVEEVAIDPQSIKPGDVASLNTDHPEVGLNSGDDCIIESVHEDAVSGRWFAVIRNGNEGQPTSVWTDELDLRPIE